MVVQAAIPIITAVGEFTTPYLLRKAGEIGLTRFIQVYGSAAATAIGIQKTQPVDLQTEKILGMPVSHITGQGEVYDDTDYSYIDEDKENEEVPTKTTEEKLTEPTEPEPPKDPDVGADLAAEAAIHTTKKLLEDKEPSVSQQTENLTSKIKNKITTWEDHFSTIEEATKAAKDVGGTLREFEEGVLYKKITFRQHNYGFDIYFDKKLIGGLNDVDPYKEDPNRKGNQKSYNLNYINEEGRDDEAFTTIDGQKYAKEKAKELIARDLLRETEESTDPLYPTSPSLRDVFQNLEYNKKGEPKDVAEGIEKTLKELEEYKEKNK
jgi:hypothetical protein